MWMEVMEGIMAALKAPYIGCDVSLLEKNESED
jgi:hypothetical protein